MATDNYENLGKDYFDMMDIQISQITGRNWDLIMARFQNKTNFAAVTRKNLAEVFKRLWVRNNQTNMIDEVSFYR